MVILRVETQKTGETKINFYQNGKDIKQIMPPSINEAAIAINKFLLDKKIKVDGIYYFVGPAGFSRLRAAAAYCAGFGLGADVPVGGYKKWLDSYQNKLPQQKFKRLVYSNSK